MKNHKLSIGSSEITVPKAPISLSDPEDQEVVHSRTSSDEVRALLSQIPEQFRESVLTQIKYDSLDTQAGRLLALLQNLAREQEFLGNQTSLPSQKNILRPITSIGHSIHTTIGELFNEVWDALSEYQDDETAHQQADKVFSDIDTSFPGKDQFYGISDVNLVKALRRKIAKIGSHSRRNAKRGEVIV